MLLSTARPHSALRAGIHPEATNRGRPRPVAHLGEQTDVIKYNIINVLFYREAPLVNVAIMNAALRAGIHPEAPNRGQFIAMAPGGQIRAMSSATIQCFMLYFTGRPH